MEALEQLVFLEIELLKEEVEQLRISYKDIFY